MVRGRSGGSRRPTDPLVGSIITGMIVGQARKGVLVELGASEALLPRSRYGAAADRIEMAGYGDALTVEVVADHASAEGIALSRVSIERTVRQPRPIVGRLDRAGSGLELVPNDGGPAFAVVVLDRHRQEDLAGTSGTWLVGAPHGGIRFIVSPAPEHLA